MTYSEFLMLLNAHKEETFATFQRRLIPTKQTILGVRTPTLRKIAKTYASDFDKIFSYPDEIYEVTFIKLAMISAFPYERFVRYVEKCVSLMDNWATCDCFKAKCIAGRREEFLPVLERIFQNGGEFYQRYALVVLLSEYVEEKYLSRIERYLSRADTKPYYVYMSAAWLTAEVLVKYYDEGVKLLKANVLDQKTHNKAIQKAIESYRLSQEQKEYLRSLKIK